MSPLGHGFLLEVVNSALDTLQCALHAPQLAFHPANAVFDVGDLFEGLLQYRFHPLDAVNHHQGAKPVIDAFRGQIYIGPRTDTTSGSSYSNRLRLRIVGQQPNTPALRGSRRAFPKKVIIW